MRANCFKRKILCAILPILLLVLSAAVVFGHFSATSSANAANGGDVTYPDPAVDKIVNLVLDLNGKDSSGTAERDTAALNANNGNRKRRIFATALRDFAELDSGYELEAATDVINPASDFIECSVGFSGSASLTLTAKQVIDQAYISVKFKKASSDDKIVYLNVKVESKIKQRESAGQNGNTRRLVVGNRTVAGDENKDDPYFITLKNNTTDSLYLAPKYVTAKDEAEEKEEERKRAENDSMLVKHRLYQPPTDEWSANKYGELVKDGDDRSPWSVYDISRFEIVSAKVDGLDSGVTFTYPTENKNGIPPVIQYSVDITANSLRDIPNADTFWDSLFKLIIEIKEIGQSQTNTEFCFFVKFSPASEPVTRLQFNMPTNLNAGVSDDKFFTDATIATVGSDAKGFKRTIVSASHLVEFPNKNDFYLYSARIPDDDSNSGSILDITGPFKNQTDGNYAYMYEGEQYFVINAKENGVGTVDFTIRYKRPSDGSDTNKIVRVAFNVYGKYTITPIQLGGKAMSENINSYDKFMNLRREGYFLTGVNIVNPEYATASINKNNLVITPRATGTTDIVFTFLSTDGITQIDVSAVLDVDLNRGNWWRMQQDWAKALIIAGASIVGIAIILFIVWMFIRGVNKSKREEQETVVPTSSYIVKLNSTIAAAQAQQRFSYSGVAAPTQTLQLGAGTASAPPPDLGALPPTSGAPVPPQAGTDTVMAPPPPPSDTANDTVQQPAAEEIYIPISDEDLIERIFVEKYEPRGMTRRSFFKSKDLQTRELEKEKARIREDVKNGMSIEEACKSEKQREEEAAAANNGAPVSEPATESKEEEKDPIILILGFDPASPLMTPDEEFAIVMGEGPKTHTEIDENGEEKLVYDELTDEEEALNAARAEYEKLVRESEILKERLAKVEQEKEKLEGDIDAYKEKLDAANADIKSLKEQITDIEVKLSSARGKEKDRLNREMTETEGKIENDKTQIKTTEDNIAYNEKTLERISAILEDLKVKSEENASAITASEQKLKECEKQARIASERAEKAKAAQKFERQFAFLSPIMETVAVIDKQMGLLGSQIEQDTQHKSELKSEVSALQTQLLGTTDATAIGNMSEAIKQKNAEITQLEKNITAATKEKSDLAIDLTGQKKQAIDFIEKEEMEYEKVVEAEDRVLNRLALDEMREKAEKDKQAAEDALMLSQTVYDELVANMDANLAEKAASVADDLKLAEDAVAEAQAELDELNAKMEAASDDEKLMMSIDQMSLVERLDELNSTLENLRANGIKANLEFKMKSEEDIKEAGEALEKAKADYESASDRISRFMSFTEATDLVTSGSGLISRERRIAEEANLKKKLAEQQNAIEQAKMQAKLAQEEAERAISDAEKASAASKEEAERKAQEAIERAEAARQEAEAKAAEEAEKAKAEIDKVKAEAEEAAEKARKEAEEAEKNRKEAESEAEKARRDAEEEALRARRMAEEEAERAKKEAEEAAEKARKEAEEAEKANAEQQAEKDARLAEKINRRKIEIAEIRRDLKTVETEAQGNELKEKFYNIQLRLDDEEKESQELKELLDRSMNDAAHAAELARYKALANKAPKRIVKKVTERVNKVPRKSSARPGARPASRPGARPSARPGARPAPRPGTRPSARPGARPAPRPGARPGARPAPRPGTRPSGTRPSGTRRPPSR